MDDDLKKLTMVEYGIGTIGKSLSYGLTSGKILYYLVNVLRMDKRFLTPMFTILRLWDGVTDLIMGMLIDKTKSRLGKFRPWILLGAVSNAIVAVFMFYKPSGVNGAGLMLYVMFMYLMLDVTYTMVDVGYWAMIPALTLNSRERDAVSMIPRVFGGVAGFVTAFFFQIVDNIGGREVNGGFLNYALLTSAAYIATSVYSGIRVKERVQAPPQMEEAYSLRKAVKVLAGNKQILVVVTIMILFNLANNLTNETAAFYFQYIFGAQPNIGEKYTGMLSMYNIMMGASQAIGLLGFPFFSRWFGRTRVYIGSMALPFIGYLVMNLVGVVAPGSFIPFAAAAFLMSAGFGSMGVMQNVMLADAVDYSEYQSGERNEGTIFSTLTFLSKVASSLSYFIVLTTFSAVNFGGEDAVENPSSAALFSFRFLMYMLPPLILLATMLVYRSKFKLKPDLMQTVTTEIQRRRTAPQVENPFSV